MRVNEGLYSIKTHISVKPEFCCAQVPVLCVLEACLYKAGLGFVSSVPVLCLVQDNSGLLPNSLFL